MIYMTRRKSNLGLSIRIVKWLPVLMLLFLLVSCHTKTVRRLDGWWAMELDSCYVTTCSDSSWYVLSNTILIDDDKSCILPLVSTLKNAIDRSGSWSLIQDKNSPDSIIFDVPGHPLQGKYQLTFYKDYDRMEFKMKLENDSTHLVAYKFVIDFTSPSEKAALDRL